MPTVICIVGKPKSGKTTLITGLIPELRARGYRVATIKHTTHEFEIDTEGKDSFKHSRAGSQCSVISSNQKTALIRETDHDLSPSELARLITDDFDIILAEGFKRSDELKIETHKKGEKPACSPEELLAIVADDDPGLDIPWYSSGDIPGITSMIEGKVLSRKHKISVFADGKPVPLKPFIVNLYHKIITDMITPLKGVGKSKHIDISIRN